jgi:23S rRNA maturation mini-RNase III
LASIHPPLVGFSDPSINKRIKEKEKSYENFVEQNPEILLPDNLELNMDDCAELVDEYNHNQAKTLERSLEDHSLAQSWTEVVKRGKNKTRSKSEKINFHDRRILEY